MKNDDQINVLGERLAALEAEVDALRGSRHAAAQTSDGAEVPVSRRAVLGRVAGAAVAGVGAMAIAGSIATPAYAASGDPLTIGIVNGPARDNPDPTILQTQTGSNSDPGLQVENAGAGDGIIGVSENGWGVMGSSNNLNAGVNGTGPALGVEGIGDTGVIGRGTNDGIGVRGVGLGAGTGVLGEGDTGLQGNGFGGPGVRAFSNLDHGVTASCDRVNKAALFADPSGDAHGLWVGTASTAAAIRVETFGTGGGITASVAKGTGADIAATKGVGIKAKGKLAPLLLVPAAGAGRPTSGNHSRGELYVDNAGALFLCTAPGTPGTWVKVTVTPA